MKELMTYDLKNKKWLIYKNKMNVHSCEINYIYIKKMIKIYIVNTIYLLGIRNVKNN